MSKSLRLAALINTLNDTLEGAEYLDARVLLDQFIYGFKIKDYHKEATGLAKLWYKFLAIPLFFDGYIRDVRVNSTAGKKLFGKYAKFGTLTATLIRVKKAEPVSLGEYYTEKYGVLSIDQYKLAIQICEVLNDYAEGHC